MSAAKTVDIVLPTTQPEGIPVPTFRRPPWFAEEQVHTARALAPNRSRRAVHGAVRAADWLLASLPDHVHVKWAAVSSDDGDLRLFCPDYGSAATVADHCGLTVTFDRAEPGDPHVRYCRWDGVWADQKIRVEWRGVATPGVTGPAEGLA